MMSPAVPKGKMNSRKRQNRILRAEHLLYEPRSQRELVFGDEVDDSAAEVAVGHEFDDSVAYVAVEHRKFEPVQRGEPSGSPEWLFVR